MKPFRIVKIYNHKNKMVMELLSQAASRYPDELDDYVKREGYARYEIVEISNEEFNDKLREIMETKKKRNNSKQSAVITTPKTDSNTFYFNNDSDILH